MTSEKFTVQNLLMLPVLQNAKLLSGAKGIGNEIYYVDILEVPELSGWVRPNEFLLTTGYSFQDNPVAICNLLDEMKRGGGAAIGIKTKRFLGEIPSIAIEKSNEYGVPLIEIPAEIPYIDITHSVMEQILNKQVVWLREVQDINSQFMNLVLHRRISELVVMIGQLLNCEVAVVNQNGEIESKTPGFTPQTVLYSQRIQVGEKVRGELALSRKVTSEDRFAKICLDQAVMVLALEFSAKDSVKRARERAREDFFIELLAGTSTFEDITLYRAKQLGFPTTKSQFIISIQAERSSGGILSNQDRGQVQDTIVKELKKTGHFPTITGVGEQIVAVCSAKQKDPVLQRKEAVEIASSLHQYLYEKYGVRFFFGIGQPREHLTQLHKSYIEAKKALENGQKVSSSKYVFDFSDIYVEDLLLDLKNHPSLNALYELYLLPIQTYDKKNGSQLLQTLDAYVRHGSNTKKVAEELFVHRNSVNYRLERIQDILQVDINDPEVMFRLDLTLRAWKLKVVGS
ncbi:PucR family transcriptional regulator [Effusibacillus lacus]|uniref:PucR family transcriptional regulator n=1 Tax=Effusibacillus lacus TaxID=1348429 RepID=A0A292YEM0_9BACL|nr:PucR family transcriptional regulator [Effusibacillus lacus]TCS75867.1 purine catabolism regulator [Effusibacillus lacus]GAX91742.1 PucR family transcriptional regulator [Effusibacillus lacus]